MKIFIFIVFLSFYKFCSADPQFKILIGFPPGGGQYLVGSIIQKGFDELGVKSSIITKPGAGGIIALNECIKNEDPYTLCLTTQSQLVHSNNILPNILKYDSKVLNYVTLIGSSPLVLVTYKENNASLNDIVLDIVNNKVTFGSGALGNSFVTEELLKYLKASKAINVEYNGVGPALKDLIGKHISYVIAPYNGVKHHIESDRIRLVASLSNHRYFNNIHNFPNFYVPDTLFGFVASENLNQQTIQKQRQILSQILDNNNIKNSLYDNGIFVNKILNHIYFKNEILKEIEKTIK